MSDLTMLAISPPTYSRKVSHIQFSVMQSRRVSTSVAFTSRPYTSSLKMDTTTEGVIRKQSAHEHVYEVSVGPGFFLSSRKKIKIIKQEKWAPSG